MHLYGDMPAFAARARGRRLPRADDQRQLPRLPADCRAAARRRGACARPPGPHRLRCDLRRGRQRRARLARRGRARASTRPFAEGAVAVKFWKDIGMQQRDPDGRAVMIDDARFDPLFDWLEQRGVPVLGHQGEPRNAWLPLDEMTIRGDREYFAEHPQYHMAGRTGMAESRAADRRARPHARQAPAARLRRRPPRVARMGRGPHRGVPAPLPERERRPRRAAVPPAAPGEPRPRQGPPLLHRVPGPHPLRLRLRAAATGSPTPSSPTRRTRAGSRTGASWPAAANCVRRSSTRRFAGLPCRAR